jgi:hypothetical protein
MTGDCVKKRLMTIVSVQKFDSVAPFPLHKLLFHYLNIRRAEVLLYWWHQERQDTKTVYFWELLAVFRPHFDQSYL